VEGLCPRQRSAHQGRFVFELITPYAGETESEGDGKVVFRVQVLRGGLLEEITSRGATSDEPIVIVDN